MKSYSVFSIMALFLIVTAFTFSIPMVYAETISTAAGSSVPGCEETNECYIPTDITVSVGTEVTWSNDDSAAHTVTSGTAEGGPDGNFDSSLFMAGNTFSVTFDEEGEYPYFCMVHPWMVGTVTVVAEVMEEEMMEEKTMEAMKPEMPGWDRFESIQDPGIGHENHQLAVLLPPSENTYAGTLQYDASEPIQLVSLRGPLAEGETTAKIWTPDGETKFELTLVDQKSAKGTWDFSGNALAVHTFNTNQFIVDVQIDYEETAPAPAMMEEEMKEEKVMEDEMKEEKVMEDEMMEETAMEDNQGGGCLIATAAYGSELAPQVQLLREVRDNTLLSTESGTSFMNGFNTFYYSFSPAIADLERESPMFKEAVKLFITPMLSTLSIMTLADEGSEASVLGLGISVIALNLGMYIAAPAVAAWQIKKRI